MHHPPSGHRSPHVQRLMGGHSSHHYRGGLAHGGETYAEGGDIGRSPMAVGGGLPSAQFRKGGKAHHHHRRHHRDAGGSLEESQMANKPINPMKCGGKAHRYHGHHKRMAMGGVGKFRKGML